MGLIKGRGEHEYDSPMHIVLADLHQPAHASALVFLLNEYALDPMGGGQALSAYTQENLARALRERTGAFVFLAYEQERPCGLLIAFEGFSTFACQPLLNLHDIAVLAEFRGRGVGRALLNAAQELALQRGCCKLTLEVLQGNTRAQSAYRAFGFAAYTLAESSGAALFWQKKLLTTSSSTQESPTS
jgi:ribosomal protein S18 acetylase RimI-like enzyme